MAYNSVHFTNIFDEDGGDSVHYDYNAAESLHPKIQRHRILSIEAEIKQWRTQDIALFRKFFVKEHCIFREQRGWGIQIV